MAKIAISEERERLAEMVELSMSEAVVLERYGKPTAVLISAERYEEMLEAFEEVRDIAAFDETMAEEGHNIPWETVKQDLGWA